MASEGGNTNDPTARRRKITERGSDRLALITAGRAPAAPSLHSSNASCPPSLTRLPDEILPDGIELLLFFYIDLHFLLFGY